MDPSYVSSGTQNPSDATSGHGCINMAKATSVVMRAKDYGSSQPNLGKEPSPPKSPLRIEKPMDKPKAPPHIPKVLLKHLGNNPNSRDAQNYSIVEDLGQTPCAMSTL